MKDVKHRTTKKAKKNPNGISVSETQNQNSNYLLFFAFPIILFSVLAYYKSSYSDSLVTSTIQRNTEANDDGGGSLKNSHQEEGNIKNGFQPSLINPIHMRNENIDGQKINFIELIHNLSSSSVRIFQIDNFLTKDECDGLSRVHLKHIKEADKLSPLLCFADANTMQKYLHHAAIDDDVKIRAKDFIKGTTCLNETMSSKIKDFLAYSFSTAFYKGESKFSYTFEERLQKVSSLLPSHGGKFQVTSYPKGIGYKAHTDCELERSDLRDRYATALVYLQDVRKGGETVFTKLNITVTPKQGRLIVWNNMNKKGICDASSIHQASMVLKGRKYILQRWYYYKNFHYLGKRPPEPELPLRKPNQPRVSCDIFEEGSCRWYDEWGYDHLVEYNRIKDTLS